MAIIRRCTTPLSLLVWATALVGAPAVGQAPGAKSPVSAPLAPPSTQTQALDVGSVVTGALGEGDLVWPEGRYLDAWDLVGRAGSTVTVDLLSDEFDAVLYLVGGSELRWDDDGAGACNARLVIDFPSSGTYTLIASTFRSDESGVYTLRVTDRPAVPLTSSCGSAEPLAPESPPNDTCLVIRWMEWLTIAAEPGAGADYPALQARERSACELGLETPSGDRWPNGRTARQFDTWYYPNGQLAFQFGAWRYPTGQLAFQFDTWYYPNGQLARQFGSWRLPDGRPASTSVIVETSLARLPAERSEELLAAFRDATGDFQALLLVVMASEAFR